jgi:glycine C-acetyltransferase
MVDECHAAGFIGATGKEPRSKMGRRYYNGNIRKALGGAGRLYHGKKRNYRDLETAFKTVFIFEFAPAIVGASIKVFELLEKIPLRDQLEWNTNYFRDGMKKAGFDIIDGDSAIVPVMLYDAKLSQNMADELLKKGM